MDRTARRAAGQGRHGGRAAARRAESVVEADEVARRHDGARPRGDDLPRRLHRLQLPAAKEGMLHRARGGSGAAVAADGVLAGACKVCYTSRRTAGGWACGRTRRTDALP